MKARILLFLLIGLIYKVGFGQEFKATVKVNAQFEGSTNTTVYENMSKALNTFVNTRKWTNLKVKEEEKIEINFIINILERPSVNRFSGDISVQTRRPVYGTNYYSPILNLRDSDFTFNYVEFQTMEFVNDRFSNNLLSVIGFYMYVALGMDQDTFAPMGGNPFFKMAEIVVNSAQNSGFQGWSGFDGQNNRFSLINNLLSRDYSILRRVSYEYHRLGLDMMQENVTKGKTNIEKSLLKLSQLKVRNTAAYYLRTFMNAKVDEIVHVFDKEGPQNNSNVAQIKETLTRIAPSFKKQWNKINS